MVPSGSIWLLLAFWWKRNIIGYIQSSRVFLRIIFSKNYSQKEQKGSKSKADSHRTAQPKAYGIMAGQIRWLRPVIVFDCPATLRDLFRFLLVLPSVRLVKMAFFFFCFFVLENNFKRSYASLPTDGYQNNGLCLSLYISLMSSPNSWKWYLIMLSRYA